MSDAVICQTAHTGSERCHLLADKRAKAKNPWSFFKAHVRHAEQHKEPQYRKNCANCRLGTCYTFGSHSLVLMTCDHNYHYSCLTWMWLMETHGNQISLIFPWSAASGERRTSSIELERRQCLAQQRRGHCWPSTPAQSSCHHSNHTPWWSAV